MALPVPSSLPHNSVSSPKLEKAGWDTHIATVKGIVLKPIHPSIHPSHLSVIPSPNDSNSRHTLGTRDTCTLPFGSHTYTPHLLHCAAPHTHASHTTRSVHFCWLGRSSHQAYLQYAAGYPSYGNPRPPLLHRPSLSPLAFPPPTSHTRDHTSSYISLPILPPSHCSDQGTERMPHPTGPRDLGGGRRDGALEKTLLTNSDLSVV